MKKNWTMRVALLMLALTLITSCFVSGTYAKYVTSGTAYDTARVAKFGVQVTATGSAFGEHYFDVNQAAPNNISATYAAGTNSVLSDGTGTVTKLVAPGTHDDICIITLTGTPEVDVRVSVESTITLTNWTIDHDKDTTSPEIEYCPIVFTVSGETYGISNSTYVVKDYDGNALDHTSSDVAGLVAAVKAAIDALTQDYEALTDLSGVSQPILPISWAWAFSSGATNDVYDTALGDKAAANVSNAATIDIQIVTTVTQLD